MRRHLVPVDILVVSVASLAVLTVARLFADRLMDPVTPLLGGLLLLPVVGSMAFIAMPRRESHFLQATWWRLITLGYVFMAGGIVARSTHLLGSGTGASVLGPALGVVGLLVLTAGVTSLELSRGSRRLADLALDVAMLSAACLLVLWCVAVRPSLHGGGLDLPRALDLVAVAVGIVLVASLLSAAFAGYVGITAGLWGALSALASLAGTATSWRGDIVDPPLVSRILWAVAPFYLAPPLLVALSPRPEQTHPDATSTRWRPAAPTVACAVPIALYLAEALAPPTGSIPDAHAIGGTLVLLCLGCIARVARSVMRAEEQSVLLEDMARSDHLTGLPNRRTADEELRRAFVRSAVDDEPVAVALCDLDHFKAFNDRYGHHAGDELLIGAAQAWAATLGDRQVVARYGGEEFLVISSGLATSALTEVVDRMRRATPRGQTFSAGIAAWDGKEDAVTLVARADAALYEAKENGRARTCVAYTREHEEATS